MLHLLSEKIQSESNNLKLEGTTEGVKFAVTKINGNTTQVQYSGKNKLNVPSNYSFSRDYVEFRTPGTYHITCGEVIKGGTNNPYIGISNTKNVSIESNMDKTLTITQEDLDNSISSINYPHFSIYSNGWSWADSTMNSTVKNLMVSLQGGDYEPYVRTEQLPLHQLIHKI